MKTAQVTKRRAVLYTQQPVEEVATAPRGGRITPKDLVVEIMIALFNRPSAVFARLRS